MKKIIALFLLLPMLCFAQSATNQVSQFMPNNCGLPLLLTNNAAFTPGTNAYIIYFPPNSVSTLTVWLVGQGTNSSASGVATIAWKFGPDGTNFQSNITTNGLTISGTNIVVTNYSFAVSNANYMEVYWASNSDSTYLFPLQVQFVPHH